MKIKTIMAAIALLCVAGGYGLYRFGLNQGLKSAAASSGAPAVAGGKAPAAAEKKPLYWQDPMNPGQKFDKPGKSPFMDMQLVPVYADDAAGDAGNISINPRLQQNLGIRTAEVTRGTLAARLIAVGSVAYNEREVALVQARASGYVEHLYVRAALDSVRKGQALADLYVPDWIAAQEEFLTIKRMQGGGMEGLIDGARQRMRLAGMIDEQIRLVESTGKVHPHITLTAPVGGVVAELSVREGMTVAAGAPLFRINGLDTVWVNAEVPESQAAQVHPGTPVEARAAALPDVVFKGKVSALLPEVNATTRTLKARIELANPHGVLVPGMFAGVTFNPAQQGEVLLVSSEAVIQTGTRSVVMLAQGDGKFLPVEVETGREADGKTEVRKGLEAGQKIVVSGQFLIDSEASLKGTATRMSDAPTNGKDAGAGK